MDKIKIIQSHFDAITRGSITLSKYVDHTIRMNFITKMQRWSELQDSKTDATELTQLTNDLGRIILEWRSHPDIFEKGIGDINVDTRTAKLEQEVEQLKKDMKIIVRELGKIQHTSTPEESQLHKRFDAVS